VTSVEWTSGPGPLCPGGQFWQRCLWWLVVFIFMPLQQLWAMDDMDGPQLRVDAVNAMFKRWWTFFVLVAAWGLNWPCTAVLQHYCWMIWNWSRSVRTCHCIVWNAQASYPPRTQTLAKWLLKKDAMPDALFGLVHHQLLRQAEVRFFHGRQIWSRIV